MQGVRKTRSLPRPRRGGCGAEPAPARRRALPLAGGLSRPASSLDPAAGWTLACDGRYAVVRHGSDARRSPDDHTPLSPKLEGLAERRFFSFARQMLDRQARDPGRIGNLVKDETTRAPGLHDIKGQYDEYTACVRVLGDLAQLRWTLVESGYGLELHSPRLQDQRVSGPAQARRRKEAIRNELRPRFCNSSPTRTSTSSSAGWSAPPPPPGGNRFRTLIADGAELQERLYAARQHPADDPARGVALRHAVPTLPSACRRRSSGRLHGHPLARHLAVLPLHLVDTADADTQGAASSTWFETPPTTHTRFIGIAALSNCAVQLVPRDRAIGWSASGLETALRDTCSRRQSSEQANRATPAFRFQGIYRWLKPHLPAGVAPSPATKRAALQRVADWLLQGVSTAIDEIECQGLASEEEIADPTSQVVERLRHRSREFASCRQEALAARDNGDDGIASETVSTDVPVDDDVLDSRGQALVQRLHPRLAADARPEEARVRVGASPRLPPDSRREPRGSDRPRDRSIRHRAGRMRCGPPSTPP